MRQQTESSNIVMFDNALGPERDRADDVADHVTSDPVQSDIIPDPSEISRPQPTDVINSDENLFSFIVPHKFDTKQYIRWEGVYHGWQKRALS